MAAADVQSNVVLSSTESESDDEPVQLTRYDVPSSSSAIIPSKVKKQIKASEGTDTSLPKTGKIQRVTLSSSLEPGIDVSSLTYLNIFREQGLKKNIVNKDMKEELESKSIIHQPGFEKQLILPPYLEGRRKVRRERLKERDKTAGPGWFNLPATEMTEERKNDLTVLQMRGSLDPKRFYKRGSEQITPKYFSIGTVIEHAVDFYHARIPKKQRKQTLVDELLADAEYTKYQKRKLAEAMKNLPKKTYTSKKNKKSKMKELNKPENKKAKHSS